MEAGFSEHMLYVTNKDKPGFIGSLGRLLGDANVNIATFNLGRKDSGGDAIAFMAVDAPVSPELIDRVLGLEHVVKARALSF